MQIVIRDAGITIDFVCKIVTCRTRISMHMKQRFGVVLKAHKLNKQIGYITLVIETNQFTVCRRRQTPIDLIAGICGIKQRVVVRRVGRYNKDQLQNIKFRRNPTRIPLFAMRVPSE